MQFYKIYFHCEKRKNLNHTKYRNVQYAFIILTSSVVDTIFSTDEKYVSQKNWVCCLRARISVSFRDRTMDGTWNTWRITFWVTFCLFRDRTMDGNWNTWRITFWVAFGLFRDRTMDGNWNTWRITFLGTFCILTLSTLQTTLVQSKTRDGRVH